MNKARMFDRSIDCGEVDRMLENNLSGDVRLDRDVIVVVEGEREDEEKKKVRLSGIAVGRPSHFIHEFRVDMDGLSPGRLIAEQLLGYCLGWLSGKGARQITFLVDKDNKAMQKFMEDHGAYREKEGIVYSLKVE